LGGCQQWRQADCKEGSVEDHGERVNSIINKRKKQ
jgi:hypothetical protein